MKGISVVVAIYQMENFLRRCLDSIRNQTFGNFEVILIDDGSFDSSGKICDEYAKNDERFRVFHKQNEGVSVARQCGLQNARGEYIIYVDPDDWIETSMLEKLYAMAKKENADMVICDYFLEIDKRNIYVCQKPNVSTKDSFFYDLINRLHGSCWNKLVRRSCFEDYKVSFVPGMVMWEDKFVNLKLACNPIQVVYLPNAFYHYIARRNSAVSTYTRRKVESTIQVVDWLEKNKNLLERDGVFELKKKIKWYAFLAKEISSDEFKSLYPELDAFYLTKLTDLGRGEDFFVAFALKFSLHFSRILYSMKMNLRRK